MGLAAQDWQPSGGADDQPLFPSGRAFVVQFSRPPGDTDPVAIRGRIEHVDSGRSTIFATYDELLGFIDQVLTSANGRE